MIKHISFKHGWFYHYRVHLTKANSLCDKPLYNFLLDMFENCPHDLFLKSKRSSSLKYLVNEKKHIITGHEINSLCKESLKISHYKTNHSKVEVFMLENDDKTVAVEVPLWLLYDEMDFLSKHFSKDDLLTGHIDLLRIENGKIWVWDYKPNSHKEKHASTQVYTYALMLSKRTGIPLNNFSCGYFDENTTYIFNPAECVI